MKTISCKEAVHFILKKEEGKLSFIQRLSLWRHLLVCNLCRIFLSQSKLMNTAIRQKPRTNITLSTEEKEKIIRHVLDENNKS